MTHLARDELVASANGLGPPPPSPGADAGHSFLSLEDGPLSSPMSSHPSGSGSGSGYNTQSSPTRGDPSHPFGSPTDSYSSSARSLSPPSNRERIAEGLQSFADFGNRSEWDSEEKEPAEQVEREDRRLFRGKDRNTRGSRLGAQLANPKTHPFASTAGLSSPPIGQGPNGKRRGSSPLDARRGQDRQTAAELDESEEMNTTAEFGKSRLWGARAGSVGSRVAERGMLFRAEDQGPGSRNEGKTETVGRSGGKPSLKLGSAFGLNPSADQGSFAQSGPSSLARNSQGGQSSGYDFGEGSLESAISPDRESGSSIGTATTVNGSMGGTTGTGHTSISARSAAFGGSSKLPPSAGGQPQATTTPNRLSRAASNSNLLGTVTSPIGGVPNTRGGRLGRLQYSKGGGISPAAPSPSWEAARGSIRDSTSGAGASSLGRASTPNLAAAFARAETAQSSATSQATAGLNQPSPTAGTASAFSRSGDSGRPSPVRTTVPANSLWATSSGDGAATVGGSAHSSSSSQGPGWDSGSSLTGLGIDGGSSNGGSATGTAVTSPGGSGPRELLLPALTKADPGGPASFNSRRTSSSAAELLNSGFAGGLHARTSSPGLSPLTTSDERFNSPTIGAGPAGSAFDATPRTSVHEMYGTGRYATPSARESSLMRAQSGSSPHSESGYSPYMQSQAQFAQASALSSGLPSGQGSLPNSPRIGDPSSPAIGGLSDSAIAALGAMPGTGPDALLNPSGAPLSSKNVLTIALQKAQSAVLLDSANNVPEAIAAYRQAVRLLQEVMERIAPKNGRKARTSREEERRRLRVIHDTYADRIRLLSLIYSPEDGAVDFGDASPPYEQGSKMEQHLNSPSLEDHRWPDRQGDASMGLTQPLSPALTQSPNSPSQLSEPGSARIPQRTSSMQPESACSDVSRGEGRSESRSSRRSQRPTTPRDREPPLPQRGSTVDGAEGIGSAMMATPASSAPTSPDANRVGMSSPPSMSSIIASSHASAGTSSSTNSRPRSASAVSMSTFPTKGESSSPPPIPIPAFRRASSPQRNDKGEGDATGFGGASQPAESASARRPLGGNAEGLVDGRAQGADGLRGWSRSRLNESTLAEELERGRATSATPTRATMGSGFGETSMPEISIHPESPMDGRPVLQDSQDAQEVLRDEDEPRKRSTHDRSDSDGSFASTTSFGRNLTAGSFHGGRAIETEGGHDFDSRLSSRNRAFGLDEELKTPATPYFDIDPTLIPEDDAQDDGSARRNSNRSSASRGSEPGRGRTGSTGTIPSARLIDPSVRQSVVSPTERTRASSLKMSASPGVAGLSALTRNSEASRTSLKTKRPSSADSPSPKFEAPADADADQTDSQSRIQAKQDLGVRPSTSGSSSLSTRGLLDNGKLLVSPSTSSGTISQRRKNSQAGVLELNRPIPSGTQSTTAWSENFSTPALKTPLSGPLVQTAPAAVSAAPGIPQSAAPSRFGDNQNAVSSSSPTDAFADGEKVNTLRQSGVPASKETAVPSSFRASLSSSFGRQRALSQPGKRPSIPPSFLASNAGTDTAPPVPRMMRKASMPSTPGGGPPPGLRALASTNAAQAVSNGQPAQQQQQGQPSRPPSEAAHHPTPFRFPSPAPTTSSGYLVTEGGLSSPAPSAMSDYFSTEKPIAIPDIFPTGLPSSASGAPSFMSSSSSGAFPWLGLASSLPDPASVAPVPSYPSLRPFHLMRQLHMSITKGGYVTRRLYVPRNLWIQQGARLMAIESKVRMLELVASGIEGVEKSGESLLLPHNATSRDGEVMANAAKFVKQLEEFDILLVEVQNTLAKKLGFLESVTGKKANSSFGALGSRLTRSIDRMTNGTKNLDTPATYVDGLARLFVRAQVLDKHLQSLLRAQSSPTSSEMSEIKGMGSHVTGSYAILSPELRGNIEAKLKRSSDFFANVVLCFVLRDLGILIDKFVKRGGNSFMD